MQRTQFRVLIEGAVRIWEPAAVADFDDTENRCRLTTIDGRHITIGLEDGPVGAVWRLAGAGQRDRVHLSIVPALRGLRAALCPDRPAGRTWFVPETGDD